MPDPSACYSEDTVELAARALFEAGRLATDEETWQSITEDDRDSYRDATRAQLDALAERGLLLPEGAEQHTEWGVEYDFDGEVTVTPLTSRWTAERAVSFSAPGVGRRLMQRQSWSTGWSPAPPETVQPG